MNTRRETKRQVIALRTMLRSNDLSNEQRNQMAAHIVELRNKLDSLESQINPTEIAARREFLQKNKGMLDIFNTFWIILLAYTSDGFLSKDGYTRFHHAIDIALAGTPTFLDVDQASVDADWTYDKLLYGNLNKPAFFDMLFEIIETWTEIVDPTYYAAFAWALLDSIADTNVHPPKLRPHREMKCITKVQNEANMIRDYIKNKKVRAALSIESEMMERIPDVQKRLHDRKRGVGFDDAHASMVEALSLQASNSVEFEFSDSDGESMHSATSLHHELLLQQLSIQDEMREEDEVDDDEGLDDGVNFENNGEAGTNTMDDELDDDSVGGASHVSTTLSLGEDFEMDGVDPSELRDQFGQLGETSTKQAARRKEKARKLAKNQATSAGGYGMRQPTASFLAYCSGRRETRMLLNGIYGTDSITSGSLNGSMGSGSLLDLSAMAMLPSEMASMSTDTDSASGTIMSTSEASGSPLNQQDVPSQLLLIPSPTNRGSLSPYGGKIGDKARFSQFMASGKRLGSFAKEYMVRHEMNSGLSIDPFTGSSPSLKSMMHSQQTVNNAIGLVKTPVHLKSSPRSRNNLPVLADLAIQSVGDLSLMGKTMIVPSTATPKTRSSYQLLTPVAHATPKSGLTKMQLHSSSNRVLKQNINGKVRGADNGASGDAGLRSQSNSFDEAELKASSMKGVTSAKVSGKRGVGLVDLTKSLTSVDSSNNQDEMPTHFSLKDTQVAPYFRAEVTDELLALNKVSLSGETDQKLSSPSSRVGSPSGKKPMTPSTVIPAPKPQVDDRSAFLIVESQPPPTDPAKAVISHKARPRALEPVPASPVGTPTRSTATNVRKLESRSPSTRSGDSFKPAAFTRTNTGEIPAPEVGVEYHAPQPLHVDPHSLSTSSSLDSSRFLLREESSHFVQSRSVLSINSNVASKATSRLSVASINIPPSPEGSGYYPNTSSGSPPKPVLSRTNSNLSFADSEMSFESHEQLKSMENIYNQYEHSRKSPMPVVYNRSQLSRSSIGTSLSDGVSSGADSFKQPQNGLQHVQLQDFSKFASPGIVLVPIAGPTHGVAQKNHSGALHIGVDLEHSMTSNNPHHPHPVARSRGVRRGTNHSILPPARYLSKPEASTFPQSMYFSVVKHALDERPQPNYNPSWNHGRACKAVRLNKLKHNRANVDMSLSLTTAPITLNNAKKLEAVIRNSDHQRKILGGTIPAERMKTPTNSLRKAPLTLNITSIFDPTEEAKNESMASFDEMKRSKEVGVNLGSALENVDFSQSIAVGSSSLANAATGGRSSPQLVPSFTDSRPTSVPVNSIPAPDALLQSIVVMDEPPSLLELSDELHDESLGAGTSGSRGGFGDISHAGSTAKSINSSSTPHLWIRPTVSPVQLNSPPNPSHHAYPKPNSPGKNSPSKNAFVDHKGKLQLKELKDLEDNVDIFQIHRNIDTVKNASLPLAAIQEQHSHVVENTATLMPIKHAYLTMNGTKHVLPDKIISSIVTLNKNKSLYDANASSTESVFLGNSSSVLIRDSTLGHTADAASHSIPWLPGGSLDLPDTHRSNQLVGLREKLELQRHVPMEGTKGVLTIRSQNAIREAFEKYVQQRLLASQHQSPVHFNQLTPQQQKQLLQQYQAQNVD